jgi:hypothetical protein
MKTALQELIEYLEKEHEGVFKDEANGFITEETRKDFQCSLEVVIDKAKSLLPKEKEQIETAFEEGMYNAAIVNFGFGDEYYIKTYETDEEIL